MNFTTCNSKSYTAPSLTITEYEIEQGFSLSYTEIETPVEEPVPVEITEDEIPEAYEPEYVEEEEADEEEPEEDPDEEEDEDFDEEGFDFGDEETTIYEVKCACGNVIAFDEDTLEEGSIICDECGETLEFTFDDEDEE